MAQRSVTPVFCAARTPPRKYSSACRKMALESPGEFRLQIPPHPPDFSQGELSAQEGASEGEKEREVRKQERWGGGGERQMNK